MDTVCVHGVSGDQELAADVSGGFAVHAGAGFAAGGCQVEALGVDGCGFVAGAFHRVVDILGHFVDADDQDEFFGAVCVGADAVCVAVDVYEYAVFGDGVGAAHEYVGVVCEELGCAFVGAGALAVLVVAGFDGVYEADFNDGHGAAVGDLDRKSVV